MRYTLSYYFSKRGEWGQIGGRSFESIADAIEYMRLCNIYGSYRIDVIPF